MIKKLYIIRYKWYSVKRKDRDIKSMKKKLDKKSYAEAEELLLQSLMLKETVIWQANEAERIVNKYSEDELEMLSWGEKEAHLMEVEELYGRLNQSLRELEELDRRYIELQNKLTKKYGKDILPPLKSDWKNMIGPDGDIEMK